MARLDKLINQANSLFDDITWGLKMLAKNRLSGFILIEAMISLVVLALGMLAIGKLNSYMMSATGIAKARAEAIQIAQSKAEELRNIIQKEQFIELRGSNPDGTSFSEEISGVNANFALTWSVDKSSQPYGLQIEVAWPSATTAAGGDPERYALNTTVAWADPARSFAPGRPHSISLPTGLARKPGPLDVPIRSANDGTDNQDGTRTYEREDGTKELLDAYGKVLLILPPTIDDPDPQFAIIRGKVFSDNAVNGFSIDLRCTTIILSSTGECVRTASSAEADPSAMNSYEYACYVGRGWYGNVGVQIGTFPGCPVSNASTLPKAKICVGDPGFATNLTTASPYAIEGHRRVYRGFRQTGNTFALTGIADGGTYPPHGKPRPTDFASQYPGVTAGSDADTFNHHFFLTKSNLTCRNQMNLTTERQTHFVRNAGGNFCLSPDDNSAADACPNIWPGWPGFSGGSGSDDGDGTGSTACSQAISGGMKDSHGAVQIIGATAASCTSGGGNSVNYNCTVTASQGAAITVRNYRVTGGSRFYDESKQISFTCNTPMSVNFEPF